MKKSLEKGFRNSIYNFSSQGNVLKEAHVSLVSKFQIKNENYSIAHLDLTNNGDNNAEFERWNHVLLFKNRVEIFRDSATRYREIVFNEPWELYSYDRYYAFSRELSVTDLE
ncbi:hypothetical protein [Leptospira weilii]|uniref:hypothetical protein n=1 Tax=Leptospira weilii TaxID=28184 RepID=UPI000565B053|nr:hypothetical protein [Leptospira weilii]